MIRLALIVLVLGVSSAYLQALAAAGPLRLQVRPDHFAFVGSDLEIRIHVARRDDPALVTIEVDGENFYRSSVDELEPNAYPTRPPYWVKRPPPGEYRITVRLFDRGRAEAVAIATWSTTILEGVPPR